MPPGLPCPNPVCTHVFTPDAIKGAAVLKCPRCGNSFQFRQPTAAPPPPAERKTPPSPPKQAAPVKPPLAPVPARSVKNPPIAKAPPPVAKPALPVAPPPPPVPLAEPVPLATAVVSREDSGITALAPPPDFVSPRLRRGQAGPVWVRWLPLLIIGFILSLGIGLAVGFWDQLRGFGNQFFNSGTPNGPSHESDLLGYQFFYPSRNWQLDDKGKLDLKCAVAMKRNDPNSWLAILTQDYKKQNPNEANLVEEGVRRLRAHFIKDESKDFFEYQIDSTGEHKLGDKAAFRMDFKADLNSVPMVGEVYMMGHNGVGYWFVTWAPKLYVDVVREEWGQVRQNFRVTKARDGWSIEPAVKLATADGVKAGYRLVYNKIIWETREPDTYDNNADLLLLGEDVNELEKKEMSAFKGAKRAYAAVLVLPKEDDLASAITAAKMYLEKQQKKDYPKTEIEDADDGSNVVTGRTEIGSEPGHLLRLKVRNDDGRVRLVYLGVIRQLEQTLVVEMECGWDHRTYWDVNFQQLLRQFQTRKGK